MTSYDELIAKKVKRPLAHGFEPSPMNSNLFEWQKLIVEWAVRQGRCALFEDCGLGKTLQQLEWARQVCQHTGGSVLILTPLAVSDQTQRESCKFGIQSCLASCDEDITSPGIWITNYEKLDKFDCGQFAGVVLDESSILKSFTGKTRKELTAAFSQTPYRLCCTATPSPNDYTELGQHAEFLGICTPAQMLATYFINDTFNTGDWRLKKHAEPQFWRWLAGWAACVSKPSDIGFADDGYILPTLNLETVTVNVEESSESGEDLFRIATLSATTMHREMRLTSAARADAVAELVNHSQEPWIVWCNTNDEADALVERIPDALEVRGSDATEYKEMAVLWFKGEICSCQTGRFRAKFPACLKNHISNNTTSHTGQAASPNPDSGKKTTRKGAKNTCANMPKETETNSEEPQSSRPNTTDEEGSNTSKTSHLELKNEDRQKSGSCEIQTSAKLSESKNLESVWNNSKLFMPKQEGDAKYAGSKTTATQESSHLLTTATSRERCGACCATDAISESDILRTTFPECGVPLNTYRKRVLIGKASMFGYGLNLQHCRNVAFVGLSYSFEDFYQALRRSYRFGQKQQVNAYIVQAQTEGAILRSIKTKMKQHQEMQENMKKAAKEMRFASVETLDAKMDIETHNGNGWTVHHGDCVRVAVEKIADKSVGMSVFSPPFADLFTYSADPQDMGNCSNMGEFMEHFAHLIREIKRIMQPGREVAVHCVDLLSTKWKHGSIQFQDFSGEIIRAFWREGFLFHSRICIWKSPVTEMQRTKAHGLLYKTLKADSSDSRVGCADYLLVFRAPGECVTPVTKDPAKYPVEWWQEVASPVWMTVDQGRVLNGEMARENSDEKHICPLQLDVIQRAIELWSNPGDLVYSPFTGIGSEGFCAVKMGRQFVGSELKGSYVKTAVNHLRLAEDESRTLFKLA